MTPEEELLYAIFENQEKETENMLQPTKYVRKPFTVDALQVTEENISEVAEWCQGTLEEASNKDKYIRVRVHRPLHDRQTKAFVGDWVLYTASGYKVYTPKAFEATFELLQSE